MKKKIFTWVVRLLYGDSLAKEIQYLDLFRLQEQINILQNRTMTCKMFIKLKEKTTGQILSAEEAADELLINEQLLRLLGALQSLAV